MKIEDIKPGDVLFRSKDGKIVKVGKVTPDGFIQHLAYTDMEKSFRVFLKSVISCIPAEYYEPATEEQRQYMDSKLAAFNGTNTEAANKRITALVSMMGDLKQENNALAERVKKLTDDNTRMAKHIDSCHSLIKLSEALDKLDEEYNTLVSLLGEAYKRISRFEKSTFERMEHDCPYDVKAKVGSLACFNCKHYIKSDFCNTKTILCAYDYDKQKEK